MTKVIVLVGLVALLLGLGPQSVSEALNWSVCAVNCNFATIQAGIEGGSDGDVLAIAAEIFVENVVIDKVLTLRGAGLNRTLVDGSGAGSVLVVTAKGVTLDGMTVRNGRATQGGGIHNIGDLTIQDSLITDNGAYQSDQADTDCGGGIYNAGTLTITHSTVSSNSSPSCYGGGIYNEGGIVTAAYSTIHDNWAGFGGCGIESLTTVTLTALSPPVPVA